MTNFDKFLSEREKILWTGRPGGGIIFRPSDVLISPLTVLCFAVPLFWQFQLERNGAPLTFLIFNGLLVAIFAYLMVGRFVADAWFRSKTEYAITSKRVLISRDIFWHRLDEYAFEDLEYLLVHGAGGKRKTIQFNPEASHGLHLRYRRLRILNSWSFKGLEALHDADVVKALLDKQMDKVERKERIRSF